MPDTPSLTRRYWRCALLGPVLGAAAGWLLRDVEPSLYVFVSFGFLYVAIPYAGLAAFMWWYLGRQPREAVVIGVVLASPLLVAIVGALHYPLAETMWQWFQHRPVSHNPGAAGLYLFAIPVGYAYVVGLTLGYWLLRAGRAWSARRRPGLGVPNIGMETDGTKAGGGTE